MAPPVSSEPDVPTIGETLGPYRLVDRLGEGGTGVVYRAVAEDGSFVALKVLKNDLSADSVHRLRFEREARAAGEVRNSHLAGVLHSGQAGGHYFLAVDYVAGVSLADRLRTDGPLSVPLLIRLAAELASGLDALHRAGLVHRDVKPSNVMLGEEGSAVLTDFGLAKGRAYTALTTPGQVVGSLHYLAPELIEGREATPASDLYGLGCTLFECLAGVPPFASKNIFQVAVAHLADEPPDPTTGRDDVPSELPSALLRALEKDPSLRPPTATAYARLLQAASGWMVT
jgi:serine/threonine-protein kinase